MTRVALASCFPKPPGIPATEYSPRAGSSVYHPIVVARDPRSTHPMVTRRVARFTKLMDRLQLSAADATLTLSLVLTCVRTVLADPH
jgi:hypothetical protein